MSIAAVGGGAAPFSPSLDMSFIHSGSLLDSCARPMKKMRTPRHALSFGGTNRLGKLYCRTGFTLQIHPDGRINGTRKPDTKFGILEFLSVAFGLVSIRGRESGKYLCMNQRGRLYSSNRLTADCVFMEKMLENWYNTYTSCRYSRKKRKWFVALNRRGKPRRGNKSRRKQKFTQFLVLHLAEQDFPMSNELNSLRNLNFPLAGAAPPRSSQYFASLQKDFWKNQRSRFLSPSTRHHSHGYRTVHVASRLSSDVEADKPPDKLTLS